MAVSANCAFHHYDISTNSGWTVSDFCAAIHVPQRIHLPVLSDCTDVHINVLYRQSWFPEDVS